MFKKVMSIGFVAFFGFSLVANICSANNECYKDGNAPVKWMGFTYTWTNDEYSTYDAGTTDYNDDGEYSNYYDSTTDSYYDYDENYDGSTTDSSYDSSNANIYRNNGLPPGRQGRKQATVARFLAKQRNNQSNNKKWGKNCNDAYALDSEEEKEEQLQEDEDLDDMRTKAIWERRKK